jgi:hypothetical protein
VSDIGDSDPTDIERIAERWRACFHTLFRNKIEDIFEIAKKIAAFHEEFNANPLVWGANWRVVCKRIVGITYGACSQHETINAVFNSPMLEGYQDTLPPKTYILYLIARAYQVNERTVIMALDNGTIYRAMREEEAKELLAIAKKDAGLIDDPFSLFPDEEPATRRKPKKYPTYKREGPDLNVPDNLEDVAARLEEEASDRFDEAVDSVFGGAEESAEETSAGLEAASAGMQNAKEEQAGETRTGHVFRDYPTYGSIIRRAASNEESDICYMIVHNEIKIYGGEVEEEVLRQILNARVNYPAFFRVMAEWDNKFQTIPVTMALRELGYR